MKSIFPDNTTDFLIEVQELVVNNDFSNLGITHGIEISCVVLFNRKTEQILMNPDWECNQVTDALKEHFPKGYYVFSDLKKEKVHYYFKMTYISEEEAFKKSFVRKKDIEGGYYTKYLIKNYTSEAIETFEKKLLNEIIEKHIIKKMYK